MFCPFCKLDPYHYEDVGVGAVPVAINCCDAMDGLCSGEKKAKQLLRFQQNPTPRKYRRIKQLREYYSL
jgi:hypothetical protein